MSKTVERNTEEVRGEWGMPLAGGNSLSPVIQNMQPMETCLIKTGLPLTSDAKGKFQ